VEEKEKLERKSTISKDSMLLEFAKYDPVRKQKQGLSQEFMLEDWLRIRKKLGMVGRHY